MDFGNNDNKKEDNTGDDLEWVSLRESMKEKGEAAFSFDAVVLNEERGCISLINSAANVGTCVWITPYAESKFAQDPAQTDGARLGRAIARAFGGSNNDEVFANANETGGTLSITKNEFKDSWAWLWEIKINS
tara:strand:- start:453 stop:851 length:399 start_codon:yes stop_codon:yes gene_type:complete